MSVGTVINQNLSVCGEQLLIKVCPTVETVISEKFVCLWGQLSIKVFLSVGTVISGKFVCLWEQLLVKSLYVRGNAYLSVTVMVIYLSYLSMRMVICL